MGAPEVALLAAGISALAMLVGKGVELYIAARRHGALHMAERVSHEATVQVQAWKELTTFRQDLMQRIEHLEAEVEDSQRGRRECELEVGKLRAEVAIWRLRCERLEQEMDLLHKRDAAREGL